MQQFNDIKILSLLILFAAAQGMFIALFLVFKRKGNLKANRYLAMILFGLCFQLYDYFMLSNSLFEQFPHVFLFSYPFTLAYAPLLFLFIKSVT